jgi:Ca2+-binding EF-hand superfamily protein
MVIFQMNCCLAARSRFQGITERTPLNKKKKTHESLIGAGKPSLRKPSVAAAVFAGYLLTGTLAFHFIEGFSYRDAFYFCVTTFTTVGYGDLFPMNPWAKVFNIFFIIFGLSIVAASVATLVAYADERGNGNDSLRRVRKTRQEMVNGVFWSLLRHLIALVFFLTIGAVWYWKVEGGTPLDSFYWATITSSAVGYGVMPMSDATRTFNCFYMLLAVLSFAFCLGKIVQLIAAVEVEKRIALFASQPLSAGLIKEINDHNGVSDGAIDHYEFMMYMLTNMGKISHAEVEEVEALFRKYDVDGNGMIDVDDLLQEGTKENDEVHWKSGRMVLTGVEDTDSPLDPSKAPEEDPRTGGWTGSTIRRTTGSPAHPIAYEGPGVPTPPHTPPHASSPVTVPKITVPDLGKGKGKGKQENDWSGD